MAQEKGFSVIYEDNHLLVVNKDAGVLVQGDETGDVPLVELGKRYIKEKYGKPGAVFLGVVHRIDRPVSGIVVLARTSKALERMNALFREKQTVKTYWALVEKKPRCDQETLVHWLVKDPARNKTRAYLTDTPGAQKSELTYQVKASHQGLWLLEVQPLTGRPHQIRVQLSSTGALIKGDVKYGSQSPNENGSICLHARRLEFTHPVKQERMVFAADPPQHEPWTYFSTVKPE